MGRYLLNLPTEASTSKYATMLPYPLTLLKLREEDDVIVDAGLLCYQKDKTEKEKVVRSLAQLANERKCEVIVNCGDYAPDAYYSEWFDLFLKETRVPIAVCGSYAEVSPERIKRLNNLAVILHVDPDVSDVLIPERMLQEHPLVDGHPKADVKMTVGCPRKCTMCPVATIYDGRFRYTDTDRTLDLIAHYYSKGVRFINFIDDNLSAGVQKFTKFMVALRKLKLSGMKFQCQEGFEVLPFKNEAFCEELARSNFVDIRIGFENIKEDFLASINKYYTKFADIELAIANIQRYKIDARMFLLLSPLQSESDIMDNLKFIAKHELNVRANVLRMYDRMEYAKDAPVRTPVARLVKLRALAYGASFMSRTLGVNIFSADAYAKLEKLGYKLLPYTESKSRIVGGKQNFGMQTSKWISGMSYVLREHFKIPIRLTCHEQGAIVEFLQYMWFDYLGGDDVSQVRSEGDSESAQDSF